MTIQLEEGKYYRTRDGRKVGPLLFVGVSDTRAPLWATAPGFCEMHWYTQHNPHWAGDYGNASAYGPTVDDLMEEWPGEPEVTQPPSIGAYIADTAKSIVSGARRGTYGSPERNFERIARYWTAYFQNTGRDVTITASDVSPMMRFVKEARLNENPKHPDSFVDLVGYTLTGAETNGVDIPD